MGECVVIRKPEQSKISKEAAFEDFVHYLQNLKKLLYYNRNRIGTH